MERVTAMTDATVSGDQPSGPAVSGKSAWVSHAVRIMAAVWGGWILVRFANLISHRSQFLELQGKALGADMSGVSDVRFYLAVALVAVVFFGAAMLAWCIWGLFSCFLNGRALTLEAAFRIRIVAVVGFVVALLDVAYRPVFYWVLNEDLVVKVPWAAYFRSDDLLHLVLAGMVYTISIGYKAAIERAHQRAAFL
jgi:hypothetical protein